MKNKTRSQPPLPSKGGRKMVRKKTVQSAPNFPQPVGRRKMPGASPNSQPLSKMKGRASSRVAHKGDLRAINAAQ